MESIITLLVLFLLSIPMSQVSWACTTVWLHRCLAHDALSLHPKVALIMHFWITFFTGLNARIWVAFHRLHHQGSDKQEDPHSPYILGRRKVLFGTIFIYADKGRDKQLVQKLAHDYKPDRVDKLPAWVTYRGLGSAVVLTLVGGAVAGLPGFGYGFWFWSCHMVCYITTFSLVNSYGHAVRGEEITSTHHRARNVPFLTPLTLGEGRHGDHHNFPSSAWLGEGDLGWTLVINPLRDRGLAQVSEQTLTRLNNAKAAV